MFARRGFTATRLQIRSIIALFFVSSILLEGYCSASVCRTSKDEQTIYSTILDLSYPNEAEARIPVVDQRTESFSINLKEFLERDLDQSLYPKLNASRTGATIILSNPGKEFTPLPKDVRIELQNQFDRNLTNSCRLPDFLQGQKKRFVPVSNPDRFFKTLSLTESWEKFHQTFGKQASLCRFSRVAFDSTRTYGLVHASSGSGPMAGGGMLYLLKKIGANWTIQHQWITWTT